jgi:hypothetical protein
VALRDEILQEIKNLRLDPHEAAPTPQLAPVRVERVIVENVYHPSLSPLRPVEETGKNQGSLKDISKRKTPTRGILRQVGRA